jgi:CheY-like chemotaxis protein
MDFKQADGMNAARVAGDRRVAKLPHVMVVEDDASLRTLWEFVRWDVPVRLSVVKDGYQAIMAMSGDHPDLVITDSHMPHIDGRKLIEIMRRTPPYDCVPVVVVSCDCTDDLLETPEVIACFRKTASFADLRRFVESWLVREQVVAVE